MKILVTGSAGFLGRALVGRLLARGERDVRCLIRRGTDPAPIAAVASRYPDAKVEIFPGSLSSAVAAADCVADVGVVYHLAASPAGAPADVFLNTVVASKNLLEAIVGAHHPMKVVLVSSFGVYGFAGLRRGAVLDESTPLESQPQCRDVYSHAKLRQERLFREYQAKHAFPLTVLRPGVIYGPGGSHISPRVGINLAGLFLFLGGDNLLPLTYVDSCAEAVVVAGQSDAANGETYNVVDDGLITARQFLSRYTQQVRRLRVLPIPYRLLHLGSRLVLAYSRWSHGQLPPVFTPYKTATTWKPTRFSNAKLKRLGWQPLVTIDEGLHRTFASYAPSPPTREMLQPTR
jgi:nucleoside-diphosphate-sugar epimerase